MADLFGFEARVRPVVDKRAAAAQRLAEARASLAEIMIERSALAPDFDMYQAARAGVIGEIASALSRGEGRGNASPNAGHLPLYDKLIALAGKYGRIATRYRELKAAASACSREIETLVKQTEEK